MTHLLRVRCDDAFDIVTLIRKRRRDGKWTFTTREGIFRIKDSEIPIYQALIFMLRRYRPKVVEATLQSGSRVRHARASESPYLVEALTRQLKGRSL